MASVPPTLPPRPRRSLLVETVCCGYKRCPTVETFDDGTARLSDTGPGGVELAIELTVEQRARVAEILLLPSTPTKDR